MSMEQKIAIELLSKHLFWDTPLEGIDVEKHKGFIIQSVLEYGLMEDWNLILAWFGISKIGALVTHFRSLDPKALAFIVNITGLPIKNFRCYTTKQSINSPWKK
jgi:hypothetical protein